MEAQGRGPPVPTMPAFREPKPEPPPTSLALSRPAGQTMTSREIADLTGKEHKNVLADIRRMLFDLGQAAAEFSATASVPGPNGSTRHIEVFNLPKRETLILVSGYSALLRARIVDRWAELERAASDPARALNDPAVLRQVLLGYTEKVIELQHQVGELTPKAKALQVAPRRFIAKLSELGWIHRRPMGSGWLAYQDRIAMGVLEHKVASGDRGDGTEWCNTQVRVTAKGMTRLAKLFEGSAAVV